MLRSNGHPRPARAPAPLPPLSASRPGPPRAGRRWLREIHLHCYRMLGSFHDAQDATQETLLRAWRSLHTFQGRAPLRAWLYRVATTTCLQMLRSQPRRRAVIHNGDPDVPQLEPYPDRLLDELPAGGPDPAAVAERRESVALAFMVAPQDQHRPLAGGVDPAGRAGLACRRGRGAAGDLGARGQQRAAARPRRLGPGAAGGRGLGRVAARPGAGGPASLHAGLAALLRRCTGRVTA
jgi:RNA polymerase sigma factor (sigma-70 family)